MLFVNNELTIETIQTNQFSACLFETLRVGEACVLRLRQSRR
jgi:hypothetical protein